MKKLLIVLLYTLICGHLMSENTKTYLSGHISFISTQNVYVKFVNTNGIYIGDTLFMNKAYKMNPIMIVNDISSISCICTRISTDSLENSMEVLARILTEDNNLNKIDKETVSPDILENSINEIKTSAQSISSKQKISGKLGIVSYTNISEYTKNERLRYRFLLKADSINNSHFSVETHINFSHLQSFPKLSTDWQGINSSLRIYSLSANYRFGKNGNIWFGRRINNSIANVGSVDGLQLENSFGKFSYGLVAGTRPDTYNYGFNAKLQQYGAYLNHSLNTASKGNMQSTLGYFNQMNNFKTDRRFTYFQHNNNLIRNLNVFCSLEMDLYEVVNKKSANIFKLTSTFASLSYQPIRQIALFGTYDSRKNIYYFETFKNRIDSLLDKSTRQGFRFGTNVYPLRNVTIHLQSGYRVPSNVNTDTVSSRNLNASINYSKLPFEICGTIEATNFKTGFTNGWVYGTSFCKSFLKDKLSAEIEYRIAGFDVTRSYKSTQHIFSLDLTWQLMKQILLNASVEDIMEDDYDGNNLNTLGIYISLHKSF